AQLSADSATVVFSSYAGNLIANDGNFNQDIFAWQAPAVAASPPTLSVTLSNAVVTISWQSATSAAFGLESTTNLNPVVVWTPVTNSVSDNGTIKSVNIDPAAPERDRKSVV